MAQRGFLAQSNAPRGFTPLFLERLSNARNGNLRSAAGSIQREDVLESIRREVTYLLNTRRHARATLTDIDDLVEFSTYNYGLADLLDLSPADTADRERAASLLARAVEAFEPRLADVRVLVEPDSSIPGRCQVLIEGSLRLDSAPSPVTFSIAVGQALRS